MLACAPAAATDESQSFPCEISDIIAMYVMRCLKRRPIDRGKGRRQQQDEGERKHEKDRDKEIIALEDTGSSA